VNASPRQVSIHRSASGIVTLIARALTSGVMSLPMAAFRHASRYSPVPVSTSVRRAMLLYARRTLTLSLVHRRLDATSASTSGCGERAKGGHGRIAP
jgi:hypothetical protein